jgi:hypothetical protein
MQTNRLRHTNREGQAISTYKPTKTNTWTCKHQPRHTNKEIQTYKQRDRLFRHTNKKKTLGPANTSPDIETNRFRHTNRKRLAL